MFLYSEYDYFCVQHMIKYRYIPFTHGKKRYMGAKPAQSPSTNSFAGAASSDPFGRPQNPMQNAGGLGAGAGVGAGGAAGSGATYLSSSAWSQPAPPQKQGSNIGPRPFAPLSAYHVHAPGPHLVHKVAKD